MTKTCWLLLFAPVKRRMLLRFFVLWLLLLFSFCVPAQPPVADSLHLNGTTVREKVFVHTDKTFYLAGETLWLKAYVLDGASGEATALSRVVYVEILNNRWQPVLQAMLPLERGLGDGSFVLPPSLPSGMYLLRAYTAWMENFEEAAFFHTPLEVVNTSRRPDWAALERAGTGSLRFFPEGGQAVEGLPVKLGFQLTDRAGNSSDGQGYVVENDRDTVSRLRPLKFGLGSFVWMPQKGARYKAVVRLAGGDSLVAPLPATRPQGTVLRVTAADSNRLEVTALTTGTGNGQPLFLEAHTNGTVTFAATGELVNGGARWVVNPAQLGEGITRFVLFDAGKRPIAERLTFRKPTRKLVISLATDSAEYGKRSAIRVGIGTHDEAGQGTGSHLSVSVFRLDSLPGLRQPLIDETLLLMQELQGRVDSPAYYLNGAGKEVSEALDNLLLVHGRQPDLRYPDAALAVLPRAHLPEYEGPLIRGRVVWKDSGEPAPGVLCYLSSPGERFYAGNAVSDARGELRFVAPGLYGPVDLVAQTAGADDRLRIELFSPFSEKAPAFLLPPFSLPEKWKDQLTGRHFDLQLASRFAPPALQQLRLPAETDTLPFYGRPDGRYLLDEYTRFPAMEEVMREVTAEVRLQTENGGYHLRVVNLPYRQHFDADPLLLLDGVPVFNTAKLLAFDPLKVKRIDVLARTYYWGNTVNSGLVSYLTYEGNLADFKPDPGVELLAYNGLQLPRAFSLPVYPSAALRNSREPDRRQVLLWQPAVVTDGDGTGEVRFAASDVPGRYAVWVQGVAAGGRVGSGWTVITVR